MLTYAVQHGASASSRHVVAPHHVATPVLSPSSPVLGVFEGSVDATWRPVQQFAAAVGRKPGIVVKYSGWNDPWHPRFASMARAHGAIPLVHMEPTDVALTSIINGHSDAYLESYAASVRRYGSRVILSFAPEMNGDWYSWGAGHTPTSEYVAAWRHVVNVFRNAGARNVSWLWTVNDIFAGSAPLKQLWPGSKYVNIVGIDGYYYRPSATFESVIGSTISELRTFTGAPIIISETAVGPVAGSSKIAELFAGVRRYHLLGLVWFDQAQNDGIKHQDWRVEDSATALAAFRRAVAQWQ